MKTHVQFKVVTENEMTSIMKVLLILNRKKMKVTSFNVVEDANLKAYNYLFNVTGSPTMFNHTAKVISKQVGVVDVKYEMYQLVEDAVLAVY